ncbi:MAG TPA: ABC transporter substrate-binding protein [Mycobacteriales bacterium]
MSRTRQALRALGVIAVLAVGLAACGGDSGTGAGGTGNNPAGGGGSKGTVKVGAFGFPESTLLANIYAKALTKAGFSASVLQLQQRPTVQPALQKGDVDVVPEYVSSMLNFYSPGTATSDDQANLTKLKTAAEAKGVTVYTPAPATDNYAFVVSKDFADKNKITTLSELAAYSQKTPIDFGGTPECKDNPVCRKGLQDKYGMKFAAYKNIVLSSQQAADGLLKNDYQAAVFNSSDGVLTVNPVVVLKDDKGLNPNDYIIPAVNKAKSTSDLETALDNVSAKLTQDELLRMNKETQNDRKSADKVAQDFVDKNL